MRMTFSTPFGVSITRSCTALSTILTLRDCSLLERGWAVKIGMMLGCTSLRRSLTEVWKSNYKDLCQVFGVHNVNTMLIVSNIDQIYKAAI